VSELLAGAGARLLAGLLSGWLSGAPFAAGFLLTRRLHRAVHPRLAYVLSLFAFAATLGAALLAFGRSAGGAAPGGAGAVQVSLGGTGDFAAAGAVVWALGVLLLGARELAGHRRLARRRRSWQPLSPADLPGPESPTGHRFATGAGSAPLAVGLWRPVVFVPRGLLGRLPATSMRRLLAHEIDHARWRDPLATAALRGARILLWPVVPLLVLERLAREESEAAADRAALAGADRAAALDYAECLLSLAARGARPARAGVAALISGRLEGRVRRLLAPGRRSGVSTLAWLVVVGAVTAVALGVPAVAVSVPGAAEGIRPASRDDVRIVIPVRIESVARHRIVRRE